MKANNCQRITIGKDWLYIDLSPQMNGIEAKKNWRHIIFSVIGVIRLNLITMQRAVIDKIECLMLLVSEFVSHNNEVLPTKE